MLDFLADAEAGDAGQGDEIAAVLRLLEAGAEIATWRAATGERKGELEKVLFALPFTEDEMPRIIADYKDPNKRERMRGDWTAYARARYRLVAEQGRAGSVR